jgi:muconate cycloisomerase
MPTVKSFTLHALELPFRKPFKHAAKERWTSDSILLKCELDDGSIGYGECLPRDYVSGESRDDAYVLLEHCFLPRLIGQEFTTWQELVDFLTDCNGRAPVGWTELSKPQTAAWAAVDLALLDAFGHAFKQPAQLSSQAQLPKAFRYSVVFSAAEGWSYLKTLLMARLYGFRQVKLKIGAEGSVDMVHTARKVLGSGCDIRVDANMAWDVNNALDMMPRLAEYGVRSFEQPLMPNDINGLAQLVRDTGLEVMVDESLNDANSLETLIRAKACTSLNVRISKCGGLVAAYDRCRRGLEEGLIIQVGCQVGESSLLSAAQLALIARVGERVRFGEGCFGHHLLKADPVQPLLQFTYGGRPPTRPAGPGFGVEVNRHVLSQWVKRSVLIAG